MTESRPNPDVPGFEVLEAIGEGGLGTVYRARQASLDRLVAIKIMHLDLASDPDAVDRFQKKWKSSAVLKHANIVQVYEAGEHKGLHYFVMEYVEGSSLAEYEKSGARLDDEKALVVAKSVAAALNYALQKVGVTHGDLKPSNIMIDSDGTVKVMDFFGAEDGNNPYKPSPSETSSVQLTSVGGDIYSLGAILQRLMTGIGPGAELPDPALPAARLIAALMREADGKLPETWSDVLEELHQGRSAPPASAEPEAHAAPKDERTQYLARTPKPASGHSVRRKQATPRVAVVRGKTRKHSADWIGFMVVLLIVGGAGWVLWHKVLQPHDVTASAETTEVDSGVSAPEAIVANETNITGETPGFETEVLEPATEIANEEPEQQEIYPPAEGTELGLSGPEDANLDPGLPDVPSVSEQSPEEFSEYIQLMSSLFQQVGHRKYGDASTLAKSWARTNPDDVNHGKMQDNIQRIEEIDQLSNVFFKHRENLINTSLRNGTIQSVKPDAIVVREKRDSTTISTDIGVDSLSYREFMGLLKRANQDQFPRNGMICLMSHRQFQKGRQLLNHIPPSNDDTAMLESWLRDWESVHRNILANKALNSVASLVRRKDYGRAERAMGKAFESYRDTDIFTWFRREETRRLNTEILQGSMAAASRTKKTNADSDASTDSGLLLTTVSDLRRPPQLDLKVSRIKNERQANHRFSHTQDVELHVSVENKEIQTGFKDLQIRIYAIAEELLWKGRYKVLIKDSDEFTLPIRGSHKYISKSAHLNFHEYGSYKRGFKYYGYYCVLYDGDGNVVMSKSSKPKLKRQQDKFMELAENEEFSM